MLGTVTIYLYMLLYITIYIVRVSEKFNNNNNTTLYLGNWK